MGKLVGGGKEALPELIHQSATLYAVLVVLARLGP